MSIHFSEIDQNSRNSLKNLPKQGFVQAILMSGRRHKKLIEFSNSIFLRFYFTAYWRWTCIQNKLGLLGFFYLRYLFSPDPKKPNIFQGLYPLNPHQGSVMSTLWSIQHLKTHLHFTTFENSIFVKNGH